MISTSWLVNEFATRPPHAPLHPSHFVDRARAGATGVSLGVGLVARVWSGAADRHRSGRAVVNTDRRDTDWFSDSTATVAAKD